MCTHFPIVIPTITRSKHIFTLVSQRVYAELGGDINFPLQWANSHSPLLHNIMSWQPITPFGKWKGPAWVFSYCTTSSDNARKVAKNCVHRADEPKNLCCSGVGRQHSSRNQKPEEGGGTVKQRDSEEGLPGSWYGYRYHSQMLSVCPRQRHWTLRKGSQWKVMAQGIPWHWYLFFFFHYVKRLAAIPLWSEWLQHPNLLLQVRLCKTSCYATVLYHCISFLLLWQEQHSVNSH